MGDGGRVWQEEGVERMVWNFGRSMLVGSGGADWTRQLSLSLLKRFLSLSLTRPSHAFSRPHTHTAINYEQER